jgi:tRNA1Val (adenine37-N6)-methyltransferase
MAFQFKQFSIEDDQSTMKVGTDAVLLGSWVHLENEKSILDIGSGSGIISLMLAQRTSAQIQAIDIDENSVNQANHNFQKSPWASQIKAKHCSLSDFTKSESEKFDLIVSNPPFFINSLKSPRKNKNRSKHTDELTYEELAYGIANLLGPRGKACLILPYTESKLFIDLALIENIYLNKQLKIRPKATKDINRVLMEFSFNKSKFEEKEIHLREENNEFSEAYKTLSKNYYLKL